MASSEETEDLRVERLLQWIRHEYASVDRADDPAVAKERANWDAISARLVPTASGDRVLVTTRPMGSCKLPLPQACILTEDKVIQSHIGRIFAGLDKYTLFALFLLWQDRVPDSYWRPYLDVLPRDVECHPITYVELAKAAPELQAVLESRPLLNRALVAQAQKLEDEWSRVEGILAKLRDGTLSEATGEDPPLKELFGSDARVLSFNDFRWANCMVISRAFNLGDVPPTMCMIPFVDSMNHDSKAASVKWLRKLFSGFFVMRVPKPLESGMELTACYHEPPKEAKAKEMADLRSFLMYGFVEGSSEYDAVLEAAQVATGAATQTSAA